MYIVPQTVVKFYRDIPWNNDYKHTIWFSSISTQSSYFTTKLKYSFTDFTYVRQNGVIRVPKIADDLYDCNYISFLNAGFGSKVFYAFVTEIEYVNNETSYIHFELDYMQTWLFDMVVKQSLVEREHVLDDTFGLHTVPENLPLGSYITNPADTVTKLYSDDPSDWKLVILAVPDSEVAPTSRGQMWGGIYTGADVYVLTGTDYTVANITSTINLIQQSNSQIVAMYCVPRDWDDDHPIYILGGGRGTTLNGYSNVKNNKLFCYPYNFCRVTSSDGDSVDLMFEDDFNSTFVMRTSTFNGQAIMYPTSYKISGNNMNKYSVGLTNLPQCIWSENSYLNYVTRDGLLNSIKGIPTSIIGGASGGMLTAGVGGGVMGALLGAETSFFNTLTNLASEDFKADVVHASKTNSNMNIIAGNFGFRIERISVKEEYAKIIDDYFTRFGYKVMTTKVPELNSRPYFNYVKTISCCIGGNISAEANEKICEIFNKGITLWHVADVGNYNVNNAPTPTP